MGYRYRIEGNGELLAQLKPLQERQGVTQAACEVVILLPLHTTHNPGRIRRVKRHEERHQLTPLVVPVYTGLDGFFVPAISKVTDIFKGGINRPQIAVNFACYFGCRNHRVSRQFVFVAKYVAGDSI